MSRCFPFPPPGYQKQAIHDDVDLLKEEKRKEKKHKKEKREKEEKEGKEKREKAKSEGKHRDQKERKAKKRDKKKVNEKERDKNKDKSSTLEEKKIANQSVGYNGEKVLQKEERGKDKGKNSDEKKPYVQVQGQNGENVLRNSLLAEKTADSKFVQELGRRIRDDEKGTGSTDWRKDKGMDRFAVRGDGTGAEGKENNNGKRVDNRKTDEQGIRDKARFTGNGIRDDARFSGNAVVQNLVGIVQNKVEEMPGPMKENIERKMDGKEKSKEREGVDKRGDKRKDKGREKKSHGKDKDREKEKKKEEKTKRKSEHKKSEQDQIKDANKSDLIGVFNNKGSHLPKDSHKNAFNEGDLRKRKDVEENGFLHDHEVRPNKLPRPTLHSSTENGRKLESYQTPNFFTSDSQGAANNHKVDFKECQVNGVIEAQASSASIPKPSSGITNADQIAEASKKKPHPDARYLSQVHSVPKLECSDFADQEWLFRRIDPPSKKSEACSSGVNKEPQVWAEALQIEFADVCALPYVIPY